jgi:plasmid replication initiation protein
MDKIELTTIQILDKEIRQHNYITNARYELSANEIDIFFYVLSILNSTNGPGTIYRIYLKDIEAKTGRKWNYKQLESSASNLKRKEIIHKKEKSVLEATFFASCEYIQGEGCVEVEISSKVRPYLIDVRNNFTSLKLYSVLTITSSFAKRIYQLCCQWKDIGQKDYSLDELKYILKLKDPEGKEKEKYPKPAAFEERVLKISKAQINEYTDLNIDYEIIKNKKKDYTVRFYIDRQKPKQLPLEFNQESIQDEKSIRLRENLKEIGIIREDLVKQVLEKKDEAFKWFYQYKLGHYQIKKAGSASGHLLTSLDIIQRNSN